MGRETASRPRTLAYAVAILGAVAASLLRLALDPVLGEGAVPFIVYFPTILLVTWYGGLRPGLLVVVLGALAADYLFIPPVGTLVVPRPADWLALVLFGGVGAGVAWIGDSQKRARERADTAEAGERVERRRMEITLGSIGDAVVSTDAAGRIVFANAVARALLRTPHDPVGQDLDRVFRIVHEETRAAVESPVTKVLREGQIVALANHTVLLAGDGTEIPIDDSAAPIRDDRGAIVGTVLVFRDITERRRAERASRLLAAIVEFSDDAILSKDLSGTITSWNAGAERIFGYAASEAIGRPVSMLALPGRNEMPEILARLQRGERLDHYQTVRRRKDGEAIHVSLTVSPVLDASGRVVGASKIVRDITERLRAEERLAESNRRLEKAEESLRTTLASIGDAVVSTDAEGRVVFVNPIAEALLGRPEAQLRGRPLDEAFRIVHEDTRAPVASPVGRVLREGVIVGLANHTVLLRPDGSEIPIDDSAAPIRDAKGALTGTVLVFRDVTKRRRAERALEESERRFRTLADGAPVMIWIADVDRSCSWLNRPWLQFTGRTLEESLGGGWMQAIHPEDLAQCLSAYLESYERMEPVRKEYRLRRHDGEWRWVIDHGTPLYGEDGQFNGYIGSCIDISDRKLAEEKLLRSNEDLQRFAFVASHDLQEPLRMITVYAQLLERELGLAPGDGKAGLLEHILDGARRMRALITDLLTYTKLREEPEEPADRVDLNAVVEAVKSNLKAAIDESGAVVSSDPLPRIRAHEAYVLPLFQNLIENAIKYRGERPPEIHVSHRVEDGQLRFAVSDNGVGIPDQYKERVFEAFKRLHGSAVPGTGIGLAICRRVVQRYGGRIWVESGEGRGTTFSFTLPVAIEEAAPRA